MSTIESANSETNQEVKKAKKRRGKRSSEELASLRKGELTIASESRTTSHDLAGIRQRLAFLCHDLRTFSTNANAAQRLNSSVHSHFIGPPYLSSDDSEFVLSSNLATLRGEDGASHAVTQDEGRLSQYTQTLAEFLEQGMSALMETRNRAQKGSGTRHDYVLCTSHDLAPLLQEACGFPKQHFETRTFRDAYKRWEKDIRKAEKGRECETV